MMMSETGVEVRCGEGRHHLSVPVCIFCRPLYDHETGIKVRCASFVRVHYFDEHDKRNLSVVVKGMVYICENC